MCFRQEERDPSRLLYTAAISISLHALILGSLIVFMAHPFAGAMTAVEMPIMKVSLVSAALVERGGPDHNEVKPLVKNVVFDHPGKPSVVAAPDRMTVAEGTDAEKSRDVTSRTDVAFPAINSGAIASTPGFPSAGAGGGAGASPGALPSKGAGAGGGKAVTTAIPSPTPPRYRITTRPSYPAYARQRGHEGMVLISAEVKADGHTGKVRIKKSSGFALLDEAALNAVRTWAFEPAKKMSKPVDAFVLIPLKFSLDDPD